MSAQDCESLSEDLFLLDMDELPPERKPAVDAHLAACPECAKKHGKFERFKAAARAPSADDAAKEEKLVKNWPDIVARAKAEAERRAAPRGPSGALLVVALVLIAAAAAAAGLWWVRSDAPPSRQGPGDMTPIDTGKGSGNK